LGSLILRDCWRLALVAGLFACDAGPKDKVLVAGPPLSVVGGNVRLTAAKDTLPRTDAAPDAPVVDEREGLVLTFNRYLKPSSVVRQSFLVRDLRGRVVSPPLVTYDPLRLSVTISRPNGLDAWLEEGEYYTVTLGVPAQDEELGGFRAIDNAPLTSPLQGFFRAKSALGVARASEPADFCVDIQPIFRARCSSCHDGGTARLGLRLTTNEGEEATARGIVSGLSARGREAQQPSPPSLVFGADMPRVDPGSPGNSFLVYKLLVGREPPGALSGEGTRLAEFIGGAPMPADGMGGVDARLTDGEIAKVERWIELGAKVPAACP
jgi:hypothetical protein